jgi:hypothetical protein
MYYAGIVAVNSKVVGLAPVANPTITVFTKYAGENICFHNARLGYMRLVNIYTAGVLTHSRRIGSCV